VKVISLKLQVFALSVLLISIFISGMITLDKRLTSVFVTPVKIHPSIISKTISLDRAVVKVFSEWGHGSGLIIDSKGLILTAAHVVDYFSATYQVQLYDGSIYSVREEKYINEELDVAVLRIDPNYLLDTIKLVPSDNYSIGTPVKIIGSPFGYNQWHSYGHIAQSRKQHEIFLDIDANPGHSGGPILVGNKCIGILVAGITMTDMNFGISSEACFAVIDIYNILYGPIHVRPH